MTDSKLLITADLENYTVGLTGKIDSNNFLGFGEGWFNIADIKDYISKARSMIESREGSANLIAGQNKSDYSEYLERFGLRCYPIGKAGVIGVHVTLSDYPYTDCRPEEVFKISGEIKSEIQLVNTFLDELSELIDGSRSSAVLNGRI